MSAPRSDPAAFVDVERVASAFDATFAVLGTGLEVGWTRKSEGIIAVVTRTPVPGLNGVWASGTDWEPSVVREMLADVANEGLPFCLQTRPSRRDTGRQLAAEMGMTLSSDVPLMVATEMPEAPIPDGLTLRPMRPGEARLHCELAGPAFGGSAELFAGVMTEAIFGHPQVQGYVGEVNGDAVATAVAIAVGSALGVFNVATPGPHRGRGYGSAITALAARTGLRAGAEFAWLQSSEAGYSVYEHLGFSTLERWPCWVRAAPRTSEAP